MHPIIFTGCNVDTSSQEKTLKNIFFFPIFPTGKWIIFVTIPRCYIISIIYFPDAQSALKLKKLREDNSWGHYVPWIFCSTKMKLKQRRFLSDARQPLVVFFWAFLDGGFPQFLNKLSV